MNQDIHIHVSLILASTGTVTSIVTVHIANNFIVMQKHIVLGVYFVPSYDESF